MKKPAFAILSLLFVLRLTPSQSQNTIGIPDIVNYSRQDYNAGTQNRQVVQDRNGILYFANYEGLLSFDGVYWKTYPLPNKTVVRSIAIGQDNRIYAGGQDDFGYFSPDSQGRLAFTSLKKLLPQKQAAFSDIWNIVTAGKDIFFRCREGIFRLNGSSVTVYPPASEWQFLGQGDNELIAEDARTGLLHFTGQAWEPLVAKKDLPPGFLATCLFPLGKDSSFLATVNTGFYILSDGKISPFRWTGPNPFVNERVLTAIPVNKDLLAIGTNLDGCYILDRKGEIIQNLSRKEGLQNNNILALFLDNNQNLWLGLDNGIDFIAYNNAIKHIYPEKLNEGLGYTSLVFDQELYVGTSNGLYRLPLTGKQDLSLTSGQFQSVPGTKGSTWGLSELNGQLLLGHHEGAFTIRNGVPVPISRVTDYWGFLPLPGSPENPAIPASSENPTMPAGPTTRPTPAAPKSSFPPPSAPKRPIPSIAPGIIAGNDLGLDLLQYEHGALVSKGNIPGFNALSQFMAIDDHQTAWVAHPYRGVFRINLGHTALSNAGKRASTDYDHPNPAHAGSDNSSPHSDPNEHTYSSPAVRLYTDKDGLPSTLKNHLFKVKGRILVTTLHGVYEYDPQKDRFTESVWLRPFLAGRNIRHLREDAAGNIWFIEDKNLGVIDFSGPAPRIIPFPELNGKMVSDFEHIYPYDPYNVFVGAEKGFYHINYEEYRKNHYPLQVRIASVHALGETDSLLYGGYGIAPASATAFTPVPGSSPGSASALIPASAASGSSSFSASAPVRIGYGLNSLHFEFSAPSYAARNSLSYSYRLQGFDKDWSEWSRKAEKDYTRLPAGQYTFEVKVRNNLGSESAPVSFSVRILPPWYRSPGAWFVYSFLLAGLVVLLIRWQRAIFRRQQVRHEEEQKRLQYLHQLELEKSEKEIIKLKNEKLEVEISHKNTELASTTMHLVQKGEVLSNIREELVRLKKTNAQEPGQEGSPEELKKILRMLQEENKTDKDWEQFTIHFDKVHSDFLRHLKQSHPGLSPNELKICAYLRMNLSSKQIARLEGISVRGVEIGRYRLRKKLGIPTETHLFDFLMQAGSPSAGSGLAPKPFRPDSY